MLKGLARDQRHATDKLLGLLKTLLTQTQLGESQETCRAKVALLQQQREISLQQLIRRVAEALASQCVGGLLIRFTRHGQCARGQRIPATEPRRRAHVERRLLQYEGLA